MLNIYCQVVTANAVNLVPSIDGKLYAYFVTIVVCRVTVQCAHSNIKDWL